MAFTPLSINMSEGGYLQHRGPPLDLDGTPIHWVARYRYLGYDLRHDLDTSHFISLKRGAAWGAYIRIFIRSPFTRASAIGTQVQLRDTNLQGNLTYLASLLYVPKASLKALDKVILQYARNSMDFHGNPCNAALLSGTRATLATHIFAREMERLYLTLRYDVHLSLPEERQPACTKLLIGLRAEPVSNLTMRGKLTNWAHIAEKARAAAAGRGAIVSTPSPTLSPSTCAHVYGRSLAYVMAREDLGPPPPGFDRIPETEPPSNGSKKHFCALSFWLVKPPGLLGNRHGFTPASAIGPGSCSGNWASLAVDHRYFAATAAQCSSYAAMHSWSFCQKRTQAGSTVLKGGKQGDILGAIRASTLRRLQRRERHDSSPHYLVHARGHANTPAGPLGLSPCIHGAALRAPPHSCGA